MSVGKLPSSASAAPVEMTYLDVISACARAARDEGVAIIVTPDRMARIVPPREGRRKGAQLKEGASQKLTGESPEQKATAKHKSPSKRAHDRKRAKKHAAKGCEAEEQAEVPEETTKLDVTATDAATDAAACVAAADAKKAPPAPTPPLLPPGLTHTPTTPAPMPPPLVVETTKRAAAELEEAMSDDAPVAPPEKAKVSKQLPTPEPTVPPVAPEENKETWSQVALRGSRHGSRPLPPNSPPPAAEPQEIGYTADWKMVARRPRARTPTPYGRSSSKPPAGKPHRSTLTPAELVGPAGQAEIDRLTTEAFVRSNPAEPEDDEKLLHTLYAHRDFVFP